MVLKEANRRLTTILMADVVGYSRLMAADEEGTVTRLKANREELVIPKQEEYHGRTVKLMGDGALMEFGSVVDAVNFAIDMQRANKKRNEDVPQDQQISYRIGINIGDIIIDGQDIYGDGVNIAARLESICEPDGIYLTENVFLQAENKVDVTFEALGKKNLKNIPVPVSVYRVLLDSAGTGHTVRDIRKASSGILRAALVIAAITAVSVTAVLYSRQPQSPADHATVDKAGVLATEPTAVLQEATTSIAILPFDNMSSDPEQEYFADGMTEDITTKISNVEGMFVISRNSAFTYKGLNVRAQQISQELGVRYLLEGSVRRAGDEVRINAQLIDGTNGAHLWAKIYDGDLTDVFALQDNITSQIVAALIGELKSESQAHPETESTEAYDNFLKGWEYYQKDTEVDLASALPYFERAVVLDPNYSRAYAAIAETINKSIKEHWLIGIDPYKSRVRLEQNLQRAMTEPTSLSHAVAASIDIRLGRIDSAIEHGKRAVALNSNDVKAHLALGSALIFAGKHEEALPILAKAMRLDPLHPTEILSLTGLARFMLEDTSAAVIILEQARESSQQIKSGGPTASLVSAYAHLGRNDNAQRMRKEISPIWFDRFVGNTNLTSVMTVFPFKMRRDAYWYGSGLLLAGVCCEHELASVLKSKQE